MAERQPGQRERKDVWPPPAARIGNEPDAARVVLERRVVQRGVCAGAVLGHRPLRRKNDRPEERRAVVRRRPGWGPRTRIDQLLVGDLAVDGWPRPTSSLFLDADPEDEIDDLDDGERGDDGVSDRCPDRDDLGDDLLRVAVDEPAVERVDQRRSEDAGGDRAEGSSDPWTANTSSASSTLTRSRRSVAP